MHIVYMEKIEGNAEDIETHHLNTLASVVGRCVLLSLALLEEIGLYCLSQEHEIGSEEEVWNMEFRYICSRAHEELR